MNGSSIGRTVRWARKRVGMTQVELAELCGVPQSTIARIERGSVLPRSATLLQLLEATGHELVVDRAIGATIDREPIRARLRLPVPLRTRQSLAAKSRRPGATRSRTIWTRDRDYRKFSGIRVHDPFAR